jgi:Bacterial PH domain
MLVRSRFAWLQLATAVIWIALSLSGFHKHPHDGIGHGYLLLGILQLFIASYYIAGYFFVWWRIDDSGLTQRRIFNTRTVPWNEITRIGPWQPNGKPIPQWLAVEYARPAPMSDRGQLLIQPTDRYALVRALRAHAPQADYEILPLEI